jgi:hypothetical protein
MVAVAPSRSARPARPHSHFIVGYVRQRTDTWRAPEYPEFNLVPMPHERKDTMPLISLIVTLLVVGVILWLINNYLPIDGNIKKILNAVVIIVVILWLLSVFGILGPMSGLRIG